jgi:hypothetical protein
VRVRSCVAILGMLLLSVAITGACRPDSPSSSQSPQELLSARATQAALMAPPTATAFVIEYVVSGDAGTDAHIVNVGWNADGGNNSETDVDIGERVWSRFVTVKPGSELHLEAANQLPDDARPVRCEIYLSGQLWDSDETNGVGAHATCNAIAGW